MRRLVFALSWLSAASVHAQVTIDTLPFDCNTASTTYVLQQDLVATGTAITISADDVRIEGNNHTITYATTSAGAGIQLAGNHTGVDIDGLFLVEGAAGGPAFDNANHSVSDLTIQNCDISCETQSTVAIRLINFASNISGLSISGNTIRVRPTSGTQGDGIAIDNTGSASIAGSIDNNTILVGGTLSTSRPAGVNVDGLGSLDIHHNNIHISGPDDNNAVIFWAASGHTVRHNAITMDCFHCRGILIDGGSSNNLVHHNQLDMNTTGSCSGIRVRYGSDNNDFHSNAIDTQSATSGYAVRYGERQNSTPNDAPDNNRFFDNDLIGISPVIRVENASSQTAFFGNRVESTDGGICVDIIVWSGIDPNPIEDLWFSHETFVSSGSRLVRISAQPSQVDQFSNIVFCATGLDPSQVTDSQSIAGWSIVDTPPCHDTPLPTDGGALPHDGGDSDPISDGAHFNDGGDSDLTSDGAPLSDGEITRGDDLTRTEGDSPGANQSPGLSGGCGCAGTDPPGAPALALLALLALGLRREWSTLRTPRP